MNKVAAIVVTYNRKELLLENIDCLVKQTAKSKLDIIVIDNASTDGTQTDMESLERDKKIQYINTGLNLGSAGGFQYGIKYAAEQGYGYVWVMDDDCMPMSNALEEFLKYDRILHGNYGFLSSQVRWKDNSICAMNVQRKTLFKNVDDFKSDIVPIKMASFVSLFIPIKVVIKLGLPIKEFFIWTDDWEYTRRISKHYKCYLINRSLVRHESTSNIGANIAGDSVDRLNRYHYLYRNDVYLYRREGIKGIIYEIFRLAAHLIRVLLEADNNRLKRILAIYSGTKAGLCFYPQIEYVSEVNRPAASIGKSITTLEIS